MAGLDTQDRAIHSALFAMVRNHDAEMVFLSCDNIPELFVAATSESKLRNAIDFSLKQALSEGAKRVQVFTKGSITRLMIDTVVKITK